jgi:aminopeptidase Y
VLPKIDAERDPANTPQLIAHSVATYARSFKGFPKRELEASVKSTAYREDVKYHGNKLFI